MVYSGFINCYNDPKNALMWFENHTRGWAERSFLIDKVCELVVMAVITIRMYY